MKYLLILLTMYFVNACEAQPPEITNSVTKYLTDQIGNSLSEYKKSEKIEGLAFSIFDNNNTILQQCLGNSNYGYPITDKTLFSIQSISKNITAMAVMIAVQDSLLNLDLPISNYLPEFEVNSCFEDNPVEKITLRMLLSHTAGFTHEAPVGSNFDYTSCSFDDHVQSISETWLKFPVGTNYSYSNLGLDLCAKIVENVSGMKFSNYLKSRIFLPLNMPLTTIDDNEIVTNDNKTEGLIRAAKTRHYKIPLIGSGAVYTNLSEFTRYVQLQMNYGEINGKKLIDKKYLNEMQTIRFYNYGLGTCINISDSIYYINHNGGGYGYASSFIWYPEYNIGSIILCNKEVNTFEICEHILKNFINKNKLVKNSAITQELDAQNKKYFSQHERINRFNREFCSNDTLYKEEWKKYTGSYLMLFNGLEPKWYAKLAFTFGYYPLKLTIRKEEQILLAKSRFGESVLREYMPGMFFTNGGEVIDFNSIPPTYKNIKLKKK